MKHRKQIFGFELICDSFSQHCVCKPRKYALNDRSDKKTFESHYSHTARKKKYFLQKKKRRGKISVNRTTKKFGILRNILRPIRAFGKKKRKNLGHFTFPSLRNRSTNQIAAFNLSRDRCPITCLGFPRG